MTTEIPAPDPLKPSQRRRVAALRAAREVLETRGAASVVTAPGRTPPDTYDLVTVARWILTGEDPWPPDPPEPIQGDTPIQPGVLYVPDDQVETIRAGLAASWSMTPAPEVRPLSEQPHR